MSWDGASLRLRRRSRRWSSSIRQPPRAITIDPPAFSAKLAAEVVSDRATFEDSFDKVESVVFIEGPNAVISGNTATVTGETQATLTGEIQHNEGAWYLVQEDGRWKIDGWTVNELSSRPA